MIETSTMELRWIQRRIYSENKNKKFDRTVLQQKFMQRVLSQDGRDVENIEVWKDVPIVVD